MIEFEAKDMSTIVEYFPHSVKKREHRLKGYPRRPRQTTDVSVHGNQKTRPKSENGVEGGTYSG